MVVHGIVLAAGASSRMGRPKMLLPVGGRTLLAACVAPLLEAGLVRVVVVIGCGAQAAQREAGLAGDARVAFVVNEAWATGLASSLRMGLLACGSADAVVMALGDQPGVRPEVVRQLVSGAAASGAPLAVPVHDGRIGHPILFGRALWPELSALTGDQGARSVVRRHFAEAACVPAEAARDLDTEADYLAFLDGQPARSGEGIEVPKPRG